MKALAHKSTEMLLSQDAERLEVEGGDCFTPPLLHPTRHKNDLLCNYEHNCYKYKVDNNFKIDIKSFSLS